MGSRWMKLALAVAVASFLCSLPPLLAQAPAQPEAAPAASPTPTPTPTPAAAPPEEKPAPGETITVVGYSEALQAGVEVKKAAPAIVDAIIADDVGKMPDKNL